MGILKKQSAGGFMDEIRCDEPSYLIWKWHPAGAQPGNNNRRKRHSLGFLPPGEGRRGCRFRLQSENRHHAGLHRGAVRAI